ncbi:Protein FAR-RED IMPAIRED RESPONSE 1 [Linum grandiflorum]
MFQEQFARIQEYELRPGIPNPEPNSLSYVVFKIYRGDRVDDRVVTVNTTTGSVFCKCKWWDTMGLLCRHCLKVMDVLGSFGHVIFRTLDDQYVLKRWTRVARGAYDSYVVTLPRTKGDEDEEHYILLFAKFGRIVRAVYSEDSLYKYIDVVADQLIDRVGKGMEALAGLFSQGLVLTVPDPPLMVSAGEDGNVAGGIPNRSGTPTAPIGIARKYPRQPKPSRNTLRYKTDTEIHRRRASQKCKKTVDRATAVVEAAQTEAAERSVSGFFAVTQSTFTADAFGSSQRSMVLD